ncbi:MAG: aldo/keto reductase [Candidatus Limivivens sp.]|nr:aldo/keto reductase [Candidatus Limivivens sp.]
MKLLTLTNGLTIPAVGFGTYKATAGEGESVILDALRAGYRYFDTASFYGNEEIIGSALAKSGIPRRDLFIASKVWKTEMGYEPARAALEHSLKRLDTDYLDVYLIHWPRTDPADADWVPRLSETWRALEDAYRDGKVRAIGLSNCLPHHLDVVLKSGTLPPAVDQIEFHPGYLQMETVTTCQNLGIQVQAWSPMGRARVLQNPLLCEIAGKYGVSTAQVCLKFALQMGVMPLPKASSFERMRQNLDLDGFVLEPEDMERLKEMPRTGWSGEHPDRERVPVDS